MNIIRWGSRLLENSTPFGLFVGVAAAAVALPVVRKGLRCGAVLATRGIYSIIDEAKKARTSLREGGEAEA